MCCQIGTEPVADILGKRSFCMAAGGFSRLRLSPDLFDDEASDSSLRAGLLRSLEDVLEEKDYSG